MRCHSTSMSIVYYIRNTHIYRGKKINFPFQLPLNRSPSILQPVVAKLCHITLHIFGDSDADHQEINAKCTVRTILHWFVDIFNNGFYHQQFWTTNCSRTCRCRKYNTFRRLKTNNFSQIYICVSTKFQIKLGATILTICGNIVVYLTIFGYFLFLDPDETTYGGMA